MNSRRYTPAFKDEAVAQVLERGYCVAEVSNRLRERSQQTAAVTDSGLVRCQSRCLRVTQSLSGSA